MIPDTYIKTFLPVHELSALRSPGANVVALSDDDLFLISKMVEPRSGS